jgi:hypothetical protein
VRILRLLVALVVFAAAAASVATVAQAGDPGTPHYPDLIPLTPSNLRIVSGKATGQKLLRFSNTVTNQGEGPFELRPENNPGNGTTTAYQRIYTHNSCVPQPCAWSLQSEFPVGTFEFHPAHNHWHFGGFALYQLRNVAPGGGIGRRVLASSDKISFCMVDTLPVNDGLPHYSGATYLSCQQGSTQGISVGWGDVYGSTLPGQSLDITRVPTGTYWLVSTADPDNLIAETNNANNVSAVLVNIRGSYKPKQ